MSTGPEGETLSDEAERLLEDLRRAKGAELAAWRRYLTAIDQRPHNSRDNDIRGPRPANRPPPA